MKLDRVQSRPNTLLSRREFLRRLVFDTCALTLAACGFQANVEQALAQSPQVSAIALKAARTKPKASLSIAEENRLPGTAEWELRHFQDDIEGFASATSVNQGESLEFYVNTNASTFDITIYRSGYYGGTGGRLIKRIENLKGVVQPDGHIDHSTGLATYSNWSPSYRLETDAAWVSGIYMAKLVRPDTGGENQI